MVTPNNNQKKAKAAPPTPTSPEHFTSPNYDFILQAIMEIQKSIGGISTKIDSITTDLGKIESRLSKLEESQTNLSHKLYAAGIMLAILLVIGGFVVDKLWDVASDRYEIVEKANNDSSQKSPVKN